MSKVFFRVFLSVLILVSIVDQPSFAQVLYSPEQYPSAQGQYLRLPARLQLFLSSQPLIEANKTIILATPPAPIPIVAAPAPIRAPIYKPHDWTGTYAGIQLGGGAGESRRNYLATNTTTKGVEVNGVTGGITVGHNEQFGNIVVGFESDFSANSTTGNTNHPKPTYTYQTANPWLTTFRPRIGYSFDRIMPYATGGMAIGNERISAYNNSTNAVGTDYNRIELGWTAGAGIEAALAPAWSVKAEYLYLNLDNAKGPSDTGAPTSTSFNEHIAHVGLNYKFGQPQASDEAPLFAYSQSSGDQISLATLTGVELGGQVSSYRYQEHLVSDQTYMHESGPNYGVTATATKSFDTGFFASADTRFAYGQNHYVGNGTLGGLPDYMGEVRALFGKDFLMADRSYNDEQSARFDISPYVGLGYRNLYNDFRGTRSNGSLGYRRDSQYLYMPVGETQRFRITDGARISTNLEYDQLVEGWQTTDLTDRSPSLPNLTTGQYGGYGLRGSVMYERESWSTGPFFDYWNINQSGTACQGNNCITEPHNQTIEYGLQARYRF